MSFATAAAVTLGSSRYEAHAVSVTATLVELPGVSSFEVELPALVALDAAGGDPGALDLDGGEGAETVLTGTIRAFRRGLLSTRVVVADASADLAAYRPAQTYEGQDGKAVVQSLASDAGAGVGSVDVTLALPAYTAHQRRTGAEHVARIARLGGVLASVDGGGALTLRKPGAQADLALRHGRELLELEVSELPDPTLRRVLAGAGPAGSASAPDALREDTEALPSGSPDPGADALWTPTPVLRTPGAAAAASQAAEDLAASGARTVHARCTLQPKLRPGLVVELQEVPGELGAGPWVLTSVVHRLDPDTGGETTFSGRSAGAGSGLGGLGGLL